MGTPLMIDTYLACRRNGDERSANLLLQASVFEASAVYPMAAEGYAVAAKRWRRTGGLSDPLPRSARLPSPIVWIEWMQDGERIGRLMELRDDGRISVSAGDARGLRRPAFSYTVGGAGSDVKAAPCAHLAIARRAARHDALVLSSFLAIINQPKLCIAAQRRMSRPARRRAMDANIGSIVWRDVRIDTTRSHTRPGEHDVHVQRPLHQVLGHWRRCSEGHARAEWVRNAWRMWIDGYWRGDPSLGTILHAYHPSGSAGADRRGRAA